jgi:hypothetical protein
MEEWWGRDVSASLRLLEWRSSHRHVCHPLTLVARVGWIGERASCEMGCAVILTLAMRM